MAKRFGASRGHKAFHKHSIRKVESLLIRIENNKFQITKFQTSWSYNFEVMTCIRDLFFPYSKTISSYPIFFLAVCSCITSCSDSNNSWLSINFRAVFKYNTPVISFLLTWFLCYNSTTIFCLLFSQFSSCSPF